MEQKFQAYEDAVKLALSSEGPLSSDLLARIGELIDDLDNTEDPVFRDVCLHLVADLATSPRTLAILERRNIPQKLVAILDEDDPLIVPHAIQFFYKIDRNELRYKYPRVFDRIIKAEEMMNKQ